MKLVTIRTIKGVITIVSGLHIGASNDTLEIGGLDQPIIKHPLTEAPYIPGSSIKGKMRALLELFVFSDNPDTRSFLTSEEGAPCGCGKSGCPACTIFGCSKAKNRSADLGPTRIIVRDAYLTDEYQERHDQGDLPMEVKYENIIHRVKGIAEHPRPIERVPAGVEFAFGIAFKVFEGDDPKLMDYVFKGLRLIELDALGGCSSRGCGQVKFRGLACDGEAVNLSAIAL